MIKRIWKILRKKLRNGKKWIQITEKKPTGRRCRPGPTGSRLECRHHRCSRRARAARPGHAAATVGESSTAHGRATAGRVRLHGATRVTCRTCATPKRRPIRNRSRFHSLDLSLILRDPRWVYDPPVQSALGREGGGMVVEKDESELTLTSDRSLPAGGRAGATSRCPRRSTRAKCTRPGYTFSSGVSGHGPDANSAASKPLSFLLYYFIRSIYRTMRLSSGLCKCSEHPIEIHPCEDVDGMIGFGLTRYEFTF